MDRGPGPRQADHDFGVVFARGQTLRRRFVLTNPGDREIPLLDAIALTPCCSTIGPLPEAIPARGTVDVPVTFTPERSSGRKRVEFAIRAGEGGRFAWRLSVAASTVPEVELRSDDDSDRSLLVGRSGSQRLSILCRRIGGEGLGPPDRVEGSPPLSARFLGPDRTTSRAGGMVEAVRDVEVLLPATDREGERGGTLRFLWDGGRSREQAVTWEVSPCVRASPPGLVLSPRAATEPQTVLVRSVDRPIRILGLDGPLADGLAAGRPTDPSPSHRLRLALDADMIGEGVAADVTITTDHPQQPTLTLSVFILPTSPGASP